MSAAQGGAPGQPPASAGPGTGQPPFGSSPATGPTQNRGHEVAGIQRLSLIISLMSQTLPLVGAASEPGIALSDAIKKLVKYVPPGTVGPAADQNAMQQLQMRQAQAGP